jgi:hypothetical protein
VLEYGDDLLRDNPNHVAASENEEGDSEAELDDVETLVAGVKKTTLDD